MLLPPSHSEKGGISGRKPGCGRERLAPERGDGLLHLDVLRQFLGLLLQLLEFAGISLALVCQLVPTPLNSFYDLDGWNRNSAVLQGCEFVT